MSLGLPPVTTELPCQRDLGGCGAAAGQPCAADCPRAAEHRGKPLRRLDFSGVAAGMVKIALVQIEELDEQDYPGRNQHIYMALYFAGLAGLRCGIAADPNEPAWPVVYIELPTGQVSWHVPQHEIAWDGHNTAEKYERCRAWEPDVTA